MFSIRININAQEKPKCLERMMAPSTRSKNTLGMAMPVSGSTRSRASTRKVFSELMRLFHTMPM